MKNNDFYDHELIGFINDDPTKYDDSRAIAALLREIVPNSRSEELRIWSKVGG